MIRYALLGLLRERADYGYRLKRRFEDHVGAVWQLNVGQVYQTLHALARDGLVREIPGDDDASGNYPSRRRFEITTEGLGVLERWLEQPWRRSQPVRNETLIRLFLTDWSRRDDALGRIADQERIYRMQLGRIEAERQRLERSAHDTRLVPEVALEAELLHTRAHLEWLDYCRQRLRGGPCAAGLQADEPACSRELPLTAAIGSASGSSARPAPRRPGIGC